LNCVYYGIILYLIDMSDGGPAREEPVTLAAADDMSDTTPGRQAVTPLNIPVSCDGTWQRRGHQSLYGIEAAISGYFS
jgi:hypothetical protein